VTTKKTDPRRRQRTTGRIAGLTLLNAMIFQEVLSEHQAKVATLRRVCEAKNMTQGLLDQWEYILDEIDYHPIFYVARQILLEFPSSVDTDGELRKLVEAALDIVRYRAALRHDLMGRVYHRLLADAKYLGTYYTSVAAATLLLKLTLRPDAYRIDWSNLNQIAKLDIADLACGTGTLLMAASEAITDNYVRACSAAGITPELDRLSKILVEETIHGYDVVLSALHLTASTMALRSPAVTFDKMQLWSLPLSGGSPPRLGSIDFALDKDLPVYADLFGGKLAPAKATPGGTLQEHALLPDLNVCVMNPPFTRSVGGNLLFGSLPSAERKKMQQKLRKMVEERRAPVKKLSASRRKAILPPSPPPLAAASITAGLGSVFAAVADRYMKPGGQMALVLPKALLSGVAWRKTRNLFSSKYVLKYLVVSHDPTRWNFSENTNLSEVLVVAERLVRSESTGSTVNRVTCVNLWKNPSTPVEALAIAHTLLRESPPDLHTGQGALEIVLGNVKFGEAVAVTWPFAGTMPWMAPCAFAQNELARTAYHLLQGGLYMPGTGVVQHASIPLCFLADLGDLGPDCRDIHDGFKVNRGGSPTPYPAFWGHHASAVVNIAAAPNAYLSPLPNAKEGRPLRKASDLWRRAGRLLLAERLRLNTDRVVAMRVEKKVLSNVWWPLALADGLEEEYEKAIALWLNSTPALIILFAHRVETEGPWGKYKKPTFLSMPVLDVKKLPRTTVQELATGFDRVCKAPLLPLPDMVGDASRASIDGIVSDALGLPDLSALRSLLSREPVVSLTPLE
jgi:galactitol-specific phosphotransferase system IIB component